MQVLPHGRQALLPPTGTPALSACWPAGESYLLLDRSLQALVQHIAHPVQDRIRQGWPVSRVSASPHPDGTLLVHGPAGQQLTCRRVIVAVPLPVLQRGRLVFSPPLPQRKQEALSRLRMGNAVKARPWAAGGCG